MTSLFPSLNWCLFLNVFSPVTLFLESFNKKHQFMVKTVAIIGAGPAGLSAVRALHTNSTFDIVVYERNDDIGGVWYYPEGSHSETAMYDWLETNLCKQIMQFKDFPFPECVDEFPNRSQVWQYLKSYYNQFIDGKDRVKVRFASKVQSVIKDNEVWQVTANGTTEAFDYVIVANGHFDKPYIPSKVAGLEEWRAVDSESIMHSKEYSSPEFFRDKTVIIVGNGSSGSDIANQVSSVASKVYHSVHDPSNTDWSGNDVVTAVPAIKQLDISNARSVTLQDGNEFKNIDVIMWATGYLYNMPFLKSYRSELFGDQQDGSHRLFNLWEQVCFRTDPTLAFSLLCKNIVPFPVSELQACLITKVFTGSVEVPLVMQDSSEPEGKDYHSLLSPLDIEYCQRIQQLLDTRGGTADIFQPIRWDESKVELRYRSAEMKRKRTKILIHKAMELRSEKKPYCL